MACGKQSLRTERSDAWMQHFDKNFLDYFNMGLTYINTFWYVASLVKLHFHLANKSNKLHVYTLISSYKAVTSLCEYAWPTTCISLYLLYQNKTILYSDIKQQIIIS